MFIVLGIYNFERAIKSVICMQLCDFFSQLSTTEVEHSALQHIAPHVQFFLLQKSIKEVEKILQIEESRYFKDYNLDCYRIDCKKPLLSI